MNDQSRKRATPSGRPSLMQPHLTKRLLQVIVGSWQVRDLIAEKQMRPIALRHFEKTGDGFLPAWVQLTRLLLHVQQEQCKTQLPFF